MSNNTNTAHISHVDIRTTYVLKNCFETKQPKEVVFQMHAKSKPHNVDETRITDGTLVWNLLGQRCWLINTDKCGLLESKVHCLCCETSTPTERGLWDRISFTSKKLYCADAKLLSYVYTLYVLFLPMDVEYLLSGIFLIIPAPLFPGNILYRPFIMPNASDFD